MRTKLISSLRPTPATVIAVLALVMAMAGGAIAASSNKGPVTVFTVTGGATIVGEHGPGEPDERVPITLSSPTSFTQKAGQMVLIAAELDTTGSHPENPGDPFSCDLIVEVDAQWPGIADPTPVLAVMDLAERGGVRASWIDSGALAAPAAARPVTISAIASVDVMPGSEECANDTYTFTIRVSVATMPS